MDTHPAQGTGVQQNAKMLHCDLRVSLLKKSWQSIVNWSIIMISKHNCITKMTLPLPLQKRREIFSKRKHFMTTARQWVAMERIYYQNNEKIQNAPTITNYDVNGKAYITSWQMKATVWEVKTLWSICQVIILWGKRSSLWI